MKYLSFDIEATGLEAHDLIIEFAMIPFDSHSKTFETNLQKHYYIQCPSFEELYPKLDPWVRENNKELIIKANKEGLSLPEFKNDFEKHLLSEDFKNYFKDTPLKEKNGVKPVILFGKSLNAIDLPFLNRDLGFEFMRKYFHHQVLDLSSVVMALIDKKELPEECLSGSKLMKHFQMGDVCHTALEDAIHTAEMYFKMI